VLVNSLLLGDVLLNEAELNGTVVVVEHYDLLALVFSKTHAIIVF
jgi:hypothetical protein